jgi:hypothetical protein
MSPAPSEHRRHRSVRGTPPGERRAFLWLAGLVWVTLVALGCTPFLEAEIPTPGAPSLGDPFYPTMGNGGYDALHYTLDLNVDVPTNMLAGTSTMRAQATHALSSFNLDLSGLTVIGVGVNGAPAKFARVGEELVITPTVAI